MTVHLNSLAASLRCRDEHVRVHGAGTVVCIAGSIGHIKSNLQVILRLAALSPRAREAAQELVDAGVIDPDASGRLFVGRMPVGIEVDLLRRALGLESFGRPVAENARAAS